MHIRSFLLILVGWGIFLPQPAFSTRHHISTGDTISARLRQALPGDTVIIAQGEYLDNLVVEIPLHIRGEGLPMVRGNYRGNVVLVLAPGTTIEGLRISESGTELLHDLACVRIEADSVTIRDNVITECLHGIYVKGVNSATITGNRVEGRLDLIPEDRGNGIHLWNSSGNRLSGNTILNVRDGIYFSFANKTDVCKNRILNVRYGLHYMYSDDNVFSDNVFEKNVAGAALMYSKRIQFHRNVFARCRGFRAYGILYQSMDETVARDNLIIDNSRGIFFDNCNFNQFIRNDVVDNDLALQMMGNGEENVITQNNFINNLSSLVLDARQTQTLWAAEDGGNHWSTYDGYDLDGNGRGDVPHTIQNVFQVLESDIPEIRFYLHSPAAEMLEVAERALPILELGHEKDEAPLMRPSKNDRVPWTEAEGLRLASSPAWAAVYLMVGMLLSIYLYRMSRLRKAKS
jgi:nitrous oxidase accessory protein